MAGVGPAPKDPKRRARGNSDPVPTTLLRFVPASQPELPVPPEWLEAWPAQTQAWWSMWRDSAQAENLTATDWSFLLDTALLHARVWAEGKLGYMDELRLRVAKFGATPEDRARLRMQFAAADEADAKRPPPKSRERYADLRVVSPTG